MQDGMITQNIIITESSKNLRALGRNALNSKWKVSIIAVCIYLICMQLPPLIFDSLFGVNMGNMFIPGGNTYGMDAEVYIQLYNNLPEYSMLSAIYVILVAGALELGITLFFLASFRNYETKETDIFLGFERFGKALGLMLFRSLFIFLWSCLFLIPGIIAAIRYSQAFFVLADDPGKGIRECMNESKAMMKGNKGKYFILSLSFIGWLFLAVLPSGIVQSIGTIISTNDFVIGIFALIGGLFVAPVTAYMYSTFAGFYEILAGHLIKDTTPVSVTPEEAVQLEEAITLTEDSIDPEDSGDDNAEEKQKDE
ncbi:MAG: DUF975 family protein [Lentihominibacter sp.]|jgi:uncharacterized membrane protein